MYSTLVMSMLSASALAFPLLSRQSSLNDLDILNFALTAEHLEAAFYKEALAKFDENAFSAAGVSPGFRANLGQIGQDESNHVTFLEAAITGAGGTPVQACSYDFGFTDVKAFVGLSSALEGIGASAYLGAAPAVTSKAVLSAAASIMSVESRHSSFVRAVLNQIPNAQALDTPLSPNQVFTLASAFITSCPSSNPPLPFKAFPALSLSSTGPLAAGSTITVKTKAPLSGTLSAAFLALGGPQFQPITQTDGGFTTTIPKNYFGQTYMVVTNSQGNVTDATVVAGPLLLEVAQQN